MLLATLLLLTPAPADTARPVPARLLAAPSRMVSLLPDEARRRPNYLAGAIGLVIGAGAGGALACLANRDDYGVYCAGQDDTKVAVGAAMGGVAGALAGALLFRR